MVRITDKKLKLEVAKLKTKVSKEKLISKKEDERRGLKKELFRLKHRKKFRFGKQVLKGFKAGGQGVVALRKGIRGRSIVVPKTKVKLKKAKKRRKQKAMKTTIIVGGQRFSIEKPRAKRRRKKKRK